MLDTTDDELRQYFEVNVLAVVELTRALLPALRAIRIPPAVALRYE